MATYIYVQTGGDVRSLLNQAVKFNREAAEQNIAFGKATQDPEFIREFAERAGISVTEAARLLSSDPAEADRTLAGIFAQQRVNDILGEYYRNLYQPDELSAQRKARGFPVAAFWVGGDSDTLLLRPVSPKSGTGEVEIPKTLLDLPESTYSQSVVNADFSYTWTRTFANYQTARDSLLLYFPVGGTKCIVAYAETGVSWVFTGTSTFIRSRAVVSGVDCANLTRYLGQDTNTTSNSWGGGMVDQIGVVRTWLVTPSTITEIINTPEPFKDQVLNFVSRYDVADISISSGGGVDYNFDDPPSGELIEIASAGATSVDDLKLDPFIAPPLGPVPTTISTSQITQTYTVSFLKGDLLDGNGNPYCVSGFTSGETTEATGYGGSASAAPNTPFKVDYYGSLRDPLIYYGSYNTFIRGPGATYALVNPDVEVSDVPSESTPLLIKAGFFPDDPVPYISLGLNYITNETFRFDYITTLFYPYSAPLPSNTYKNTARTFSVPTDPSFDDGAFVIRACWDWNSPAYCRQQLLDLGFTEEDLTPPPENQ